MTEYIVLCAQVIGGNGRPFQTVYNYDGKRFDARADAISHGFVIRGSDDFNIGVVDDGRLVSLDWMQKPVDTDPAILRPIAQQVGLR